MRNLFKRICGRLRHTISDKAIKSEMLRYPVNLPEPENAETFCVVLMRTQAGAV